MSKQASLSPIAGALAYPYLLELFHGFEPWSGTAGISDRLLGVSTLLGAVLVPLWGCASRRFSAAAAANRNSRSGRVGSPSSA